jgi:hypothetical protein
MTGGEAFLLPAIAEMTGSAALASAPAWLGAGLDSAIIGGLGSHIMGGDPLKGALLGGLTGGLFNAAVPQGIGSLFGGASDAATGALAGEAESLSPALIAADPTLAQSVTGAAAPSLASKAAGFLPYAGLGIGAMALDNAMKPEQVGPAMPNRNENYQKSLPLNRTQQFVDPNSYSGIGGNRSYFDNVNPLPTYYRNGGVVRMSNGGSSSASSSNIPRIKGKGDGRSDSIPAMLSDGEFVISAPVVSALGNGSNDAGAKRLDGMQKKVLQKHYKGGRPTKAQGIGSYVH